MLFTSREVRIGKNCARGRRPRSVSKTEGTVFPNTDRPRLVNNNFVFFSNLTKCLQKKKPEQFRAVIMARFSVN